MSEQKPITKLYPFDHMGHQNPMDDVRALRKLANRMVRHERMIAVEIGAWAGATTLTLADLGYRVFAVDHWEGSPYDQLGTLAKEMGSEKVFTTFCRNMGPRLFSTVYPLRGTSKLWAEVWKMWGLWIDLLYIDACHEYESSSGGVLQDITLWTPFVREGGIISGHDFGCAFPGVQRAVHETGRFELVGECTWWRWKTTTEKPTAA